MGLDRGVAEPHLLVDGSAVGRLNQHFDLGVGQLLHVPRRQRRPPLPRVDVLAADGHDGPVVVKAPPLRRTAPCPVTMVTQKPEHAGTLATDTWRSRQVSDRNADH